MGFPAAIREKARYWVALSCAGHLVSTGLGEENSRALVRSVSEVWCKDFLSYIFAREEDF